MAEKKVRASAFVNATLKTTAPLTFIDPETGESKTDDFTVIYRALSPRQSAELGEWLNDLDRKTEALLRRAAAHDTAEAQRRLRHDADEADREEKAQAAGETFTPTPFEARPFEDPETESLRYALAQLVARMVVSLPDIVDDEGEAPIAVTPETLSGFAESNLRSIRDAIWKHGAADPTKPASSPST
jgi:hypothetical protein